MGAHAFIFSYVCATTPPQHTNKNAPAHLDIPKDKNAHPIECPQGPPFAGRWVAVKRMAVIVVRVALTKRI